MARRISLEELKSVILSYAWDGQECSIDYDLVFDFLVKFNLLNLAPNICVVLDAVEDKDEVL